jgi:hypothetical protein
MLCMYYGFEYIWSFLSVEFIPVGNLDNCVYDRREDTVRRIQSLVEPMMV